DAQNIVGVTAEISAAGGRECQGVGPCSGCSGHEGVLCAEVPGACDFGDIPQSYEGILEALGVYHRWVVAVRRFIAEAAEEDDDRAAGRDAQRAREGVSEQRICVVTVGAGVSSQ